MAVDKLVDSTQLNSDLTSIANAIRTKGGTSAQLAFPSGFVSAIGNISPTFSQADEGKVVSNGALVAQTSDTVTTNDTYDTTLINSLTVNVSGGGYSIDDLLDGTEPDGTLTITTTSNVGDWKFNNRDNIVRANILSSFPLRGGFFNRCNNLEVIFAPYAYREDNTYLAQNCGKLHTVVLGNINNVNYGVSASGSALTKVDLVATTQIGSNGFSWNVNLNTIIIRGDAVVPLSNINAFDNTPFKSGGAGGTIYIKKALYDALGTGTNDYKSETNWSTVDGYGTITWAPIEGSQYENYYADGTPIPTT